MKKRKSHYLTRLQSLLRSRALRETDEETRRDYWSLYYKARNAEHEVREMVMDAEMRRLLEFAFPHGIPDDFTDDTRQPDKHQETPQKPDGDTSINDEDIPPRQKGLWE